MKKIYSFNTFYKILPFFAKLFQNPMLTDKFKKFIEKNLLENYKKYYNSYEFMAITI